MTRDRPHGTIPFNRPALTGAEADYVNQALGRRNIGPGGRFSRACQDWLTGNFDTSLALPTGSCTAALEIAAMLLDLHTGDEVIMPSFGYPSTANAFVRAGAVPVFVDVDPASMNIDPQAAEDAITDRTRAIVPIHYAGQPANMGRLLDIARRHKLLIVEDAANAFLSTYKDRRCGTMGAFGCFSFHETKSVHCGQGGALLINDVAYIDRAEIILEKGTDRRNFIRNEVDRYTWKDIGSAYALDDIRASFLLAQLEMSAEITRSRVDLWHAYHRGLSDLAAAGRIEIPPSLGNDTINGTIFWLKAADEDQRDRLIGALATARVQSVFHYIPLHSADAGRRFGRFHGPDTYTSAHAARLVRLPMYDGLQGTDRIIALINAFFEAEP